MAVAAKTLTIKGNLIDIRVQLAAIITAGGEVFSVAITALGFMRLYVQHTALTAWVGGTTYLLNAQVTQGGNIYSCQFSNNDAVFTPSNWNLVGPVNTTVNYVPSNFYIVTVGYTTGGTAGTDLIMWEGDARLVGQALDTEAAKAGTTPMYIESVGLSAAKGLYGYNTSGASSIQLGDAQMAAINWF